MLTYNNLDLVTELTKAIEGYKNNVNKSYHSIKFEKYQELRDIEREIKKRAD